MVILREVCRQMYDPRSLDAVRYHSYSPHRPVAATGIVVELVSKWIDVEEWYAAGYAERLRAEIARLKSNGWIKGGL